jgi:hypothetical protein
MGTLAALCSFGKYAQTGQVQTWILKRSSGIKVLKHLEHQYTMIGFLDSSVGIANNSFLLYASIGWLLHGA